MSSDKEVVLRALALMAQQYLTSGEMLDSMSMSAGEAAIDALAHHGLVTVEGRCAAWTEKGLRLLAR